MEFEAITTQEQLDAVIKSRLERETKKHAEATAELQKELESLKAFSTEASEKLKGYEEKAVESENLIKDLTAKVKTYETDSVKTRISREFNIPYELRDRLKGETEEEIKADAQALAELLPKPSAPQKSTETVHGEDDGKSALREMVKNLH